MREKHNPSYTHLVRLFYHVLSYIRLLLMIQEQILVGGLRGGHLVSLEVTNRFLLITHDWNELETWAWSHCVCLVTTHRLICNRNYLGQHVTSRDLDLRSNFDPNVQGHHAYASMHLDKRKTTVPELCRSLSLFKSYLQKKTVVKTAILTFLTSAPKPLMLAQILWNNSERSIQEPSNVFFHQSPT